MRSRSYTKYRVMGAMRGDFRLKMTKQTICWIQLIGSGRPPNLVDRLVHRKVRFLDLELFPYLARDESRSYFSDF